jgi:hypothetical protein
MHIFSHKNQTENVVYVALVDKQKLTTRAGNLVFILRTNAMIDPITGAQLLLGDWRKIDSANVTDTVIILENKRDTYYIK